MSFNSTQFVAFFVVVYFASWALSRARRSRLALLFVASCVFYMSWNAKFILLILFSAVLDFLLGRAIHRSANERRRKLLLGCSLTGNLGLLGFFKYFNFFAENWIAALGNLGLTEAAAFEHWDIVLPVGISFYTFQTLSYTLDIYRRQLEPTDSFLKFALFVAFFPQLVAGPIVRAKDFLPQLDRPPRFDDEAASRGLFLIACGMIKKVALADTIGVHLVDPIYADPAAFSPFQIVLGVWGALFQFYLDFSAYSDIAIGAAAMIGFELPINFDRPFLSQSISEFWRRWHISLSTWFRDYVFFSLGGTRTHAFGRFKNILVTMLLTGLWHGAGWNYVIWGGMHGVLTWVGSMFGRASPEDEAERSWSSRFARRCVTFNLVALSMLFFRNGTVAEGNRGVDGSLDMLRLLFESEASGTLVSGGWIALAVAAAIHFTPRAWVAWTEGVWLGTPTVLRGAALAVLTGILAVVAVDESPFIYFQF